MKLKTSKIVFAAMALPFCSMADVTPAGLFMDHMVIQRDTQAPVWGTADAGEQVTVTGSWGESACAVTSADGKWRVQLQTPAAGGPYTLSIQGNNSIEIKDVLSGEVWFCSGQSNMGFMLEQMAKIRDRTAPEFIPVADYVKKQMNTAKDAQLRQFKVEQTTSPLEPLDTLTGSWIESSPESNPQFSATAYFFARELRKELKVPVGLIKCAWGGTKVEPWIPAVEFQKDQEMAAYFESQLSVLQEWDPDQAEADYQAVVKKWESKGKGRKPKKPAEPKMDKQFPSTLFNSMVYPVIPYAIKGVIWYQGEENTRLNTERYGDYFKVMVRGWREQWGQGDFPFYFAQLASFKDPVAEPVDFDGWASVCDQQRRALCLKNTGMAVLNDIGEANDIHPHNKVDAGKRLALWALKHDYGQDELVCSGPLYKRHEIKDGTVIITFDSVGSGLMSGVKTGISATKETDEPLQYFQICGADRQWKWAQAEITGSDSVTVSHPDVPDPVVVRYAWASNPETANLYNKEGLPTSIFTTEADTPR
jgi:sialate O-acetylesterase